MGMFDHVIVSDDVDLPGCPHDPSDLDWQTKSVGHPWMRTFKIEDGRLFRQETEREQVGERELPFTDENDEPVTAPTHEIVEEWWVDHNYHGELYILDNLDGVTYAYTMLFNRGQLVEDSVVKHD